MQVGFHHGVFAEPYETQANKQGFTLGRMASTIDVIGKGLVVANIYGVTTDREYKKLLKRFQDKIIMKHLEPIKEE